MDPQVFATPATFATSPSWGDINNDGKLDLALGAWKTDGMGDLKIFRNNGAGQLQLQQSLPKDWTFTPRFADLDGDRFQDMMAVADFEQTSWYRNPGNGLFSPAGTSACATAWAARSATSTMTGISMSLSPPSTSMFSLRRQPTAAQ